MGKGINKYARYRTLKEVLKGVPGKGSTP